MTFIKSNGILIVGASNPARLIASYLRDKGKRIVIIDSNKQFIEQALEDNLEALNVNIYDDELTNNIELNDVGYLIALTANDTVNKQALENFSGVFGEHGSFKIASSTEINEATVEEKLHFFTPKDDYINLSEAFRENPIIHQVKIKDEKQYKEVLSVLYAEEKSIPLFVEKGTGLYLITEYERDKLPKKELIISYLGKKIV